MENKTIQHPLKKHLQFSAFLLAGASLLSRVLGVLRDSLIAHGFGAGTGKGLFALDAYYVAFKIPDALYSLLIAGTFSAVFIPLYVHLKEDHGQELATAWVKTLVRNLLKVLVALVLLAEFLAPFLVPLLAAGLAPEEQHLAVQLTQIMLLSPLFMGLSALAQGIENAHHQFWGMALAPLVYNASLIVAAWVGPHEYGVFALAWGVVIGAGLHAAVQIPGLFKTPVWRRHAAAEAHTAPAAQAHSTLSATTREFWTLALPRMLGASATQITTVIDTALATLISKGTLSVFTYAFNLQSLPYGVVAVSISTAWFSTLSTHARNPEQFLETYHHVLEKILYWSLPAVLGLFLMRTPLVELLLERGTFTAESTQAVASLLSVLVWVALPESLMPLFTRSCYAFKQTKKPVQIALSTVLLVGIFSVWAVQVWHASILVLAWAALIRSTVNVLGLMSILAGCLKMPWRTLLPHWEALKIVLIGLILLTVVVLGAPMIFASLPTVPKAIQTVMTLALAAGVYCGSTQIFQRRFHSQE